MKPIAIVYTSNTGYTAQYASLLGGETGLRVLSLEDAMKNLPQGSPILYLGWLTAGKVQGYDKAVTQFDVQALCAVGMAACRGVYKLMMLVMSKTVAKKLAAKPDRTPDEDDMLDLFRNGGNRVSLSNLQPVLAWCEGAGV